MGARILTQTISTEEKEKVKISGEGHTSPYFFTRVKIRVELKPELYMGEGWDGKLWGGIWDWGKSWGGIHKAKHGVIVGVL